MKLHDEDELREGLMDAVRDLEDEVVPRKKRIIRKIIPILLFIFISVGIGFSTYQYFEMKRQYNNLRDQYNSFKIEAEMEKEQALIDQKNILLKDHNKKLLILLKDKKTLNEIWKEQEENLKEQKIEEGVRDEASSLSVDDLTEYFNNRPKF